MATGPKFSFKVNPPVEKSYEFRLNDSMALELIVALGQYILVFDSSGAIDALYENLKADYQGDLPNVNPDEDAASV